MATTQDPEWKVIGYSVAGLLIIALAVMFSPFVLIAGVVIIAFKLNEWQLKEPGSRILIFARAVARRTANWR